MSKTAKKTTDPMAQAIEELFVSQPNEEVGKFIANTCAKNLSKLIFLDNFSSNDIVAKFVNILDQKYFDKFMNSKHSRLSDKTFSDMLSIDKLKAWVATKIRSQIVDSSYFNVLIRLITSGLINIFEEHTNADAKDDDIEDDGEDFDEDIQTLPNQTLLQYIIKYYGYSAPATLQPVIETLMFYDNTHNMKMFMNSSNLIIANTAIKFYANQMEMLKLELSEKERIIAELQSKTK
jgi:hypothetical protein